MNILEKHASVPRSVQIGINVIYTLPSNKDLRNSSKMHDSSINMSALVAFWVTAVLYGMNVIIFACAIRVLYYRGVIGFNRVIFAAATMQFILATGFNITCLLQLIKGFITEGNTPDGPMIYFRNAGSLEHVFQVGLYFINSIIGDGILIWRLHILWRRNWLISGPFARFSPMVLEWILSFLLLSLSTQLGATLLIAYRIWADTAWGAKSYPMMIFWIIIESGALYGFTTAIFLGLHLANADAQAIPGAALGMICAIIPTSIIVRVGMDRSSAMTSRPSFRARGTSAQDSSQGTKYSRNDTVQVQMTHQTTTTENKFTGSEGKDEGLV
ncbi:hypothetical protein B0H13DRAFT_2318559 [Mycena leptocephala]|nr:hypothetical protein B0H13DRAFT_2318559 [Mycena leptocephala]